MRMLRWFSAHVESCVVFCCSRGLLWTIALGFLLAFAFAEPVPAQNANNALTLSNNYFVTGDYVVGGVGLRGLGVNGLATGTIHIPDANSVPATGVPAGADILAAFLYWETVEKDKSTFTGQQGFFNGFPITGAIPGNPVNPPTSWSSGGCAGSAKGTTVIRAYRADVRPFLNLDANGNVQTPNTATPGSYTVQLADSGSNGGGTPLTLGASLVIIWRVLSPAVPLNSIILYDGAAAPNNGSSILSQQMFGFYQAAASPVAKLTHIVGNGQPNKSETVSLNNVNLLSLYTGLPAFPGIYGGSWDNPTWTFPNPNGPNPVIAGDSVTTVVTPGSGNAGSSCVDWGAIIFSTTVQDSNGDGLLDAWKNANPPGYSDVISNQNGIPNPFVALPGASPPGASPSAKDIFVEIDYLSNLDGLAGPYLHSHLPKQAALDRVGDAFAAQSVHVHFDVGNVYQSPLPGGPSANCGTQLCDPYIVSNPAGTGGHAISESAVVCTDSATLCQFPGTPAVGWKEGLLFVKNNATLPGNVNVPLGNFQAGRKDSYHYVLFGHALGEPRSYWSTFGFKLASPLFSKLVSIVNSGNSAVVTIESPAGLLKPGDCPNPGIPACSSDANVDRVTVAGALGQPSLNGTYHFTNLSSSIGANSVTTTTFTIATSGVASGTYNFSNEPRLAAMYLGPTSSSGHSDLGGGDSEVTFGLWGADENPATCQADPSQPLTAVKPAYCNNELGTVQQQAGTLMHEVGHTLTLTHGGTYYDDPNNPSVPTYGLNCKPNFLSVMSYLFQVRGFPDGGIDYSSQLFSPLDETNLNEKTGIGNDSMGGAARHFTRWYAPPNALDAQVRHFATLHCDGMPKGPNETAVRVDGSTFSAPIDWNNDLVVPPAMEPPIAWQDVNFNGSTSNLPDAPFLGFNDWNNVDLLQIGARENALGFSGGTGAGANPQAIGGGTTSQAIGGGVPLQAIGGGANAQAIGGGAQSQAIGGGTLAQAVGGGTEQDEDTANSSADAPTNLTCSIPQNGVPGCIGQPAPNTFLEIAKSVPLTWTAPSFGQTRRYDVWRAVGSFPTRSAVLAAVQANPKLFSIIPPPNGTITGTPPQTFTVDPNVKNGVTYTYFVTDKNKQGAQSGASDPIVVIIKF